MQCSFTLLKYSIFIFLLFSYACKKNSPVSSQEEELKGFYTELPQDFIEFYKKFHTDSTFQMAHILFPLPGQLSLSNEGDEPIEDYTWNAENWRMHRTPDLMNGTYKVEYTNVNNLITETIKDKDNQFAMVRRFTKSGNDWLMIFYKDMGK